MGGRQEAEIVHLHEWQRSRSLQLYDLIIYCLWMQILQDLMMDMMRIRSNHGRFGLKKLFMWLSYQEGLKLGMTLACLLRMKNPNDVCS